MFKNFKTKTFLSPIFVLFSIVILYFGNLKLFLIYAVTVSLHEIAHYYVSKKLGYELNKLYLMPYGVCLNYKESCFSGNDEIYIALAGPAINLLFCVICVSLWWMFPETYYYLDYFCFCNLMLATINLLPCFPLDGGRIFVGLLSKKFDREVAQKISVILNYIISLMLVVCFILTLFTQINYSYIIFSIFLFVGCLNPNKYSAYNYLSLGINKNSILKNGANIKILAFNGGTPIYKIMAKFSRYKFNIVYVVLNDGRVKVLSETHIQNLAIKYSPTYSLNDVLLLNGLPI